jgi:hypothetical protein
LYGIRLQFGQTQQQSAVAVIFNKIFSIGICSGQDIINIPPAAIPGRCMPFRQTTTYMNKLFPLLTIIIGLTLNSCNGQTQTKADKNSIDDYKTQILPETEMRVTTDKAVKLIQNKNYVELKKLFADDISKNISDQQIIQLVDQINLLFQNEGVPTGNENILPALNASMNGKDTVFVNNIMYNFKPISEGTNSTQKVLTFSFLKKYGTQKLVGANVKTNPLSAGNSKPTIKPLESFNFSVSDITRFRIYYDEGANRHTQFKNETGYFAIEGDASTLEKSGVKTIVQSIFSDLAKSKFEKVEPFNSTLNRGDKVKFIQAEFGFKDKPYTLFVYLPIENGGQYSNKIIVMQRQYVNLGYVFVLNQKDYSKITSEFPKIADLKLDNFYVDKP